MTFNKNAFGEMIAKWDNKLHPDNPNFMQVVKWTARLRKDGRADVGYQLQSGTNIKVVKRADNMSIESMQSFIHEYI
jgi:mevalonate pyrophosphate decarboxylase